MDGRIKLCNFHNSSATADFMIHSTLMNEQYSHQIENFKNTVDVRVKEMQ